MPAPGVAHPVDRFRDFEVIKDVESRTGAFVEGEPASHGCATPMRGAVDHEKPPRLPERSTHSVPGPGVHEQAVPQHCGTTSPRRIHAQCDQFGGDHGDGAVPLLVHASSSRLLRTPKLRGPKYTQVRCGHQRTYRETGWRWGNSWGASSASSESSCLPQRPSMGIRICASRTSTSSATSASMESALLT